MITNLKKFIANLNSSQKQNKLSMYSQIIRNERKKKGLTLAEVSKGICSISYLCKLEKNDIVADESYIEALFERVDLDYSLVGKNILENGIEIALKAYLSYDFEKIYNLYNNINDTIFNAQNYLIKSFYYLIKKQYLDFNKTIKIIDNIKNTLSVDDVGVFLFLVIEFYINTYQIFSAKETMNEIANLKFSIEELNWLLEEQCFNISFYIEDYNLMYYYYNFISNRVDISYPLRRKVFARLKVLYVLSKNDYNMVQTELSNINDMNILDEYYNDFMYWLSLIKLNGNKFVSVYKTIKTEKLYFDQRLACLMLICAHKICNKENIEFAITNVKVDYDSYDVQDSLFIKFMELFLAGKDKVSYIDFLRENIISKRNSYRHWYYYPLYLNEYLYYLKKGSRYKEAFNLLYEKFNFNQKSPY